MLFVWPPFVAMDFERLKAKTLWTNVIVPGLEKNGWDIENWIRNLLEREFDAHLMEAMTSLTMKTALMIQMDMPKKMSSMSCVATTGKRKMMMSRIGSAFRCRVSKRAASGERIS
jgi:hypothetical protein